MEGKVYSKDVYEKAVKDLTEVFGETFVANGLSNIIQGMLSGKIKIEEEELIKTFDDLAKTRKEQKFNKPWYRRNERW